MTVTLREDYRIYYFSMVNLKKFINNCEDIDYATQFSEKMLKYHTSKRRSLAQLAGTAIHELIDVHLNRRDMGQRGRGGHFKDKVCYLERLWPKMRFVIEDYRPKERKNKTNRGFANNLFSISLHF